MDTPIEHVPQQVAEALGWRRSAPIEPVEHPAVNEPFGFFAVTKKPLDPDEIEVEPPCVHKLFHGEVIATGADFSGPRFVPQPLLALDADFDFFKENGVTDATAEIRKTFTHGRYAEAVAPGEAEKPTANHDSPPAPPATPTDPPQKLAKSIWTIVAEMKRDNLVDNIKRQLDEGETIESLAAYAEQSSPEHATLIRQIGTELEKASGDIEDVTVPETLQELMVTARANIGDLDDGESFEDWFAEFTEEIERLRTPTPLGTPTKY